MIGLIICLVILYFLSDPEEFWVLTSIGIGTPIVGMLIVTLFKSSLEKKDINTYAKKHNLDVENYNIYNAKEDYVLLDKEHEDIHIIDKKLLNAREVINASIIQTAWVSEDGDFVSDATFGSQLARGIVGGLVAGKVGTAIGVASAYGKKKEICSYVIVKIATTKNILGPSINFLKETASKTSGTYFEAHSAAERLVNDIKCLKNKKDKIEEDGIILKDALEKKKDKPEEKLSAPNNKEGIADTKVANDKDELLLVKTPSGAFWQLSFTYEGIRKTIILGKDSSLSYEDALEKSAKIKALFQK